MPTYLSNPLTSHYANPGYWVDGYAVEVVSENKISETTIQNVIPSYLYWQFNDDKYLQAFVASYNTLAQQFVNTFNKLNLPIYAGDNLITGKLLDWVALGIYDTQRPILYTIITNKPYGMYDTSIYGSRTPYDDLISSQTVTSYTTTDDTFKRILTWNLYRGDGNIFNAAWLKRRTLRFLQGLNGTDPGIDQTYLVSVQFNSGSTITIDISNFVSLHPNSPIPYIFQAAFQSKTLNVPFQYQVIVNIVPNSSYTFAYQQSTTLFVYRRSHDYQGWQLA